MFTSSKKLMGEFANRTWSRILGWIIAVILIILNIYLILNTVGLVK